MVQDRFDLLFKLCQLNGNQLGRPVKAASAYAEALADVAFYSEPIDKLIDRTWPVRPGEHEEIRGPMGGYYRMALHELSEVQQELGDLDAAIETKTRELLAGFILASNYRDGTVTRSARELWSLLRMLPADASLPRLFWFNVLSPERDTITLELSRPEVQRDVCDVYDPNIVALPGYVFDTLEVTAEMESRGAHGRLVCYTVFEKHTTLGAVPWHADKRKGRERICKTFKIPEKAEVIRFNTWPRDSKDFRVHQITVKATFRPKMGPAAQKGVPALTKALKDEQELVRTAVSRALEALGKKPSGRDQE
ncbi:MAG: hypothetical protein ACYTG0_28520 [Planctomycetota bacterium]